VSFRTYAQLGGTDASGLGEQVARQHARVHERLRDVSRVVAVISGKGGVGKSWVSASLAKALANRSYAVGVLDADLQSPTVARLLQARGPLAVDTGGVQPATGRYGIRVMSMDLLLDEGAPLRWTSAVGEAHTWRGIAETGALREFLGDVVWGVLDVLLVDMPPDTHRLDDLAALVPALAGAIAITLPSEESRRSVARALSAAITAGVPLLGLIENMSGYVCDRCGETRPMFGGDAGRALAAEFGIPLIAQLPFLPGTSAPRDEILSPAADVVLASASRSTHPPLPELP
jgi:ATP-binding protein involved in chromosome partitioning